MAMQNTEIEEDIEECLRMIDGYNERWKPGKDNLDLALGHYERTKKVRLALWGRLNS